jgi:hypothetical protein
MNALSHATSSILANNLRAPCTPGLLGHPSTGLIGARASNFDRLLSFINAGSGGTVRLTSIYLEIL